MRHVLTLALALGSSAVSGAPAPTVTAIKAGHLLDVAHQKVQDDVVIVVENGRYKEIGTTDPPAATTSRISFIPASPIGWPVSNARDSGTR
jgi:hypothetical protein